MAPKKHLVTTGIRGRVNHLRRYRKKEERLKPNKSKRFNAWIVTDEILSRAARREYAVDWKSGETENDRGSCLCAHAANQSESWAHAGGKRQSEVHTVSLSDMCLCAWRCKKMERKKRWQQQLGTKRRKKKENRIKRKEK